MCLEIFNEENLCCFILIRLLSQVTPNIFHFRQCQSASFLNLMFAKDSDHLLTRSRQIKWIIHSKLVCSPLFWYVCNRLIITRERPVIEEVFPHSTSKHYTWWMVLLDSTDINLLLTQKQQFSWVSLSVFT